MKRIGRPPIDNPTQRLLTLHAPAHVVALYRASSVEAQREARRRALAALVAALMEGKS
jgi:hypothetical protein